MAKTARRSRRRSRRRSTFASRRFTSAPRARRRRGTRRASGDGFALSLKRPVPLAIAAVAGGVGLWGLTWALGKAQQKMPALAKPYVSSLALGGLAVVGGIAIAKYGRQRLAGMAVAMTGLGFAGFGLLNTIRGGVSGVGYGRESAQGTLPQYTYSQMAGAESLPDSVRIAAAA